MSTAGKFNRNAANSIELSKDGQPIFFSNGAPTCSFENPFEEAARWAERSEVKLKDTLNLFVLGLGSGYHVHELVRLSHLRQIWVVDDRKEAINFYLKYHKFDHRFKFVHISSKKEFKSDHYLRQCVLRPYKVVSFFPAIKHQRELYSWIEALLLGRTQETLNDLIEMRGDFKSKARKPIKIVDNNQSGLLSIKEIKPILESEFDLTHQQQGCLGILQELIK
jgi:hypothetical protein